MGGRGKNRYHKICRRNVYRVKGETRGYWIISGADYNGKVVNVK